MGKSAGSGGFRSDRFHAMRPVLRWLFHATCWVAIAVAPAAWLLGWAAGDAWWLATTVLYGPRWVFLVPAVVLLPVAVLRRSRLAWLLTGAIVFTLWPLMGLSLGLAAPPGSTASSSQPLRLLTCNVAGTSVDWNALVGLIAAERPDVVLLQESPDPALARGIFPAADWHCQSDGSLFIASRHPIVESSKITNAQGWRTIAAFYRVATPRGLMWVVNVHLDTPRRGLEALRRGHLRSGAQLLTEDNQRRREESRQVRQRVDALQGCTLIGGDFNLVVESRIFQEHWGDLKDAFNVRGRGYGYTRRTRFWGARIDHILSPPNVQVRSSRLGADVGSDHLPLIVDLHVPIP